MVDIPADFKIKSDLQVLKKVTSHLHLAILHSIFAN